MSDFIAFSDFLDRTASAKFQHFGKTLETAVQRSGLAAFLAPSDGGRGAGHRRGARGKGAAAGFDPEEEFTKMKKFILEHYKDVKTVVHSFLDRSGNHVDCIPLEEQPTYCAARAAGFKKLRTKPSKATTKRKRRKATGNKFGPRSIPIVAPLQLGLTDVGGRKVYCPDGCVPIRRITLPRLTHLGEFNRFFQKGPAPTLVRGLSQLGDCGAPPDQAPDHRRHRYAHAFSDPGNYFGCAASMNVWDVPAPDHGLSLGQLWIVRHLNPNTVQTVEGGWQVNRDVYGTSAPVLFVFFNPDNYGRIPMPYHSGYLTNDQHLGFIPHSQDWVIGGELPVSAMGGEQRGFRMQWQQDDNRNWVFYLQTDDPNDEMHEIGYFPGELYEGGPFSGDFDEVQFGGEVASNINSNVTGPMGSGIAPSDDNDHDFTRVAFQNHLMVQTTSGGQWQDASLTPDHSCAPNYDLRLDSSDKWGTFMFYGGDRAG